MPSKIGEAILVIKANAKGLKTGLDNAQTTVKNKFGAMEKRLQGFAGKIPIVGGELKGLGGPALIASAAIGIAVTAVAGMVKKTLDLGRSLGEAREKLGVSAEKIQIWRRAIEETNGKADAFDKTVLRLQRSIGEAGTGNDEYAKDFEAIGLSWQALETMSPEDALLAVLSATNDNLNASDGAAVKAGLLGRAYADMGGLANDSGADIQDMLDKVADSAVVMGGDAVTNVDEYDAAMREMRDTIGKIAITVGTKLIPKITDVINGVQEMFNVVSPVLIPALKVLGGVIDLSVIRPLIILKGAIVGVSQIVRGDFSGAWNTAKETAVNALSGIVTIYNNTIGLMPGVAQIDMQQVRDAIGVVSDKANDDLNPALEDTKEAMDDAAGSTKELTSASDKLGTSEKTAAERVADTRQAILDKKQAADDAEAGLSDGMLPTLDELIASMEESEEATDDTAESVRDLTSDTISFSEEGSEALTEAELSQGRSYDNLKEKTDAAALAATDAADEIAAAAKKAADETKAETDRMISSWDAYTLKQDETIIAMKDNGIDFTTAVELMATDLGISTLDMKDELIALGVTFGDTMGLIEAVGREKLDKVIAKFGETATAAAETAQATKKSWGDMMLATGASQAAISAAFGVRKGDPAKAGQTDYYAGKYDHIVDGSERHRLRILDEQGTRDRAQGPATPVSTGLPTPGTGNEILDHFSKNFDNLIIPKLSSVVPPALSDLPDMVKIPDFVKNGRIPPITINGDVYGWDDWVDKVGEANIEIEERGG